MKRILIVAAAFAATLFAGSAGQAQDSRFPVWKTAPEAQCLLVIAAGTGSSAKLITTFQEMLRGRASPAELERAMKPLLRLIQQRRPVSARAYELFTFADEMVDTLVIITFSDGVKLFTHLTLAKARDGWSFLGLYYNVNWEKVRPRLSVPAGRNLSVPCPAT